MLFQSYSFIFVFLPLVLLGWWQLNHYHWHRVALVFLLACSLFFYGYFNVAFLPVLMCSILANYAFGHLIARRSCMKRLWLLLALLLNIGSLVYFKYTNFFIANINTLFQSSIGFISILLPIGISFFTFQQIAYLIDVYRGEVPEYHLYEYALFVSFFPCVMSGPIALHNEVIPQLRDARNKVFSAELFACGIVSFSQGIAKKVLLADAFGAAADWGFASVNSINSTTAFVVTLSYTFQLYFDFSGYTDMARGVGLMLGLRLPQNFAGPYKALTIGQFWKCWHMTMTRFFTRYLYIPLGGSRNGTLPTCLNILIVFLLSGLWHGANWTFVIWGALHGSAMVADRLWGKHMDKLHPALSWGLTFGFVNLCWVFFRAESVSMAQSMFDCLFRFDFGALSPQLTDCFRLPGVDILVRLFELSAARVNLLLLLVSLLLALLICLQGKTLDERLAKRIPNKKMALLSAMLLFWSLISLTGVTTFLYSDF